MLGACCCLAAQPNLVFILADDCAYTTLGCYGGTNVQTPNIDRLAKEGMRFTQAYASTSMCVPFRHELHTGLFPMGNGSLWNHSATKSGTKGSPHYLGALGYRVGITGKRHVFPEQNFPFEIVSGFEVNCVAKKERYEPQEIVPFLTRDSDEPFALFINSTNPHRPWTMGDASRFDPAKLKLPPALADTPVIREELTHYLAEVAELDRQVGDVLQLLDEHGLSENTLVMFSSEQGWQFAGGKWNCWNLSLHTGLIARWPGRIKPGSETDAMVQICDVLPTLIEAAGGTPDNSHFDGRSFLPVLEGKAKEHRQLVFGMHNNVPEGKPYPIRTVFDGTHRYIQNLTPEADYMGRYINFTFPSAWFQSLEEAERDGDAQAAKVLERFRKRPEEELYKSMDDPYEMNNLAGNPEYGALKKRLRGELEEWMMEQGDPGAEVDNRRSHKGNRKAAGIKEWKHY